MAAARTRTVQNVLTTPGGTPVVGRRVLIRLAGVGFVTDDTTEIVTLREVFTDATGKWTATLEVNADIDPAGTYYKVNETGTNWAIVVPAGSGAVNMRDCLVTDPENPSPVVTASSVPAGGTSGQVLGKASGTDFDTHWVDQSGGAAGTLLAAQNLADVANAATARTNLGLGSAATAATSAFDAAGAASSAQSAAVASSAQRASNLSDLASASTARTNLGLGSAATQATAAFDAAGAATAAQSAAIAASAQRASNLSDLANAATARTNLGLGTAATSAATAFDAAGAATAAQAAAIAASAQRASNLSDLASASTARTNLGLGTAATQPTSAFDAAGAAAAAVSGLVTGVSSVDGRAGAVSLSDLYAPASEAVTLPLDASNSAQVINIPSAAISTGPIETVDARVTNNSVSVSTANRTIYVQLPPHAPRRTVSQIRCCVIVSSGNISMGIYAGTGYGDTATIGSQLATTGAFACPAANSTTYANLNTSVTVGPGDWLALSCDNITATFARAAASLVTIPGRMYAQNTAHPVTAPSAYFQTGQAFWLQAN